MTLDTGALIALERGERRARALLHAAWARGVNVTVPTSVIVEWWRGPHGRAGKLLEGLDVEPLTEALAKTAGMALGRVGPGPSATDAVVMASAARRGDVVCTGDIEDLTTLSAFFPTVRLLRV